MKEQGEREVRSARTLTKECRNCAVPYLLSWRGVAKSCVKSLQYKYDGVDTRENLTQQAKPLKEDNIVLIVDQNPPRFSYASRVYKTYHLVN